MSTNSAPPPDTKFEQAVRAHLGRIAKSTDPSVLAAKQQLERELKKAKAKPTG